MADDPLAAYLAGARERRDLMTAAEKSLQTFRALQAATDVSRLLAAVEAVLEVHALTEHVRLSCRSHARDGWDPLCPKCDEYDGCTACSYVPVRPEQCETRQAITRALTGDEAADASR